MVSFEAQVRSNKGRAFPRVLSVSSTSTNASIDGLVRVARRSEIIGCDGFEDQLGCRRCAIPAWHVDSSVQKLLVLTMINQAQLVRPRHSQVEEYKETRESEVPSSPPRCVGIDKVGMCSLIGIELLL